MKCRTSYCDKEATHTISDMFGRHHFCEEHYNEIQDVVTNKDGAFDELAEDLCAAIFSGRLELRK